MSSFIRCRRITAASPASEKLGTFLRHLEVIGSVSFAAQRTGIGCNTVYERRKVNPAFARGKSAAVPAARFSRRSAAKAGAGADASEHHEHERNRRRVGVLSGGPERP